MPRARLIFDGDWVYTEKEARIHKLTQDAENKIESIPGVIDNVNSTSTTDALSANMGKALQDQINNLAWMGTFLSNWDCTTGLPETEPIQDPYTYKAWNYYIVSKVSDVLWENKRPHWSQYNHWVPSTTVETGEIHMNDWYIYDWVQWLIQPAWDRTITIDDMLKPDSRNPVENRAVYSALTQKQNVILDLAAIRSWAAAGATAIQPGDNITELTNNVWYQTAWDVAVAIQDALEEFAPEWVWTWVLTLQKNSTTLDTFSANALQNKTINITMDKTDVWLSNVDNTADLDKPMSTATKTYVDNAIEESKYVWPSAPENPEEWMLWYDTTNHILKIYNWTSWEPVDTDTTYTAGANVQISNQNVISSTDTTYTAWSWLSLSWTEFSVDTSTIATKSYVDTSVSNSKYVWPTAPQNPTEWMLWYDTTNDVLKIYDWTNWTEVWASDWDMKYEDFYFEDKTWATVTLWLSTTIVPTSNFTVNAPATIEEWQTYILRVTNWYSPYTMTLGQNITNPYQTDTDLTSDWLDQFVFLAVDWKLELQPEWVWQEYFPWDGIKINNGRIAIDRQVIASITVTGNSLWSFMNACKANWTKHEIWFSWSTTYTFKWIWYIQVWWMYWYALSLNGIDIFNYSFSWWSYFETRFLWPYTASVWDVVRVYVPWSQAGWIWWTIYDYYDDTLPVSDPWIYYNSSQQLVTMSSNWVDWFTISDRDLWWSPDSRWSIYYWWDWWNEDWEVEISSKPGYRCMTETDYSTMKGIFDSFFPWEAYDFRPYIHMTTSASQYSDTSDNTYYWTSKTNTDWVAYTRNLPSYSYELPSLEKGSDAYKSWVSSYPTPRQHPVRPVKNTPVQPTLWWDVLYQPS